MENRAKMRKRPNYPGLRRGISPICPWTLEHSLYTFLMINLLLLSQKWATKLKKKPVLLDQFRTVPFTFSISFPKIMGQVRYFIIPPYQIWCSLGLAKISFSYLMPIKSYLGKTFMCSARSPLVSEGIIYSLYT